MAFVIKTANGNGSVGQTVNFRERLFYGGNAVGVGDEVFVWHAENAGGAGLAYRGTVARRSQIGDEVEVAVQLNKKATTALRNVELEPLRDVEDVSPQAGLAHKLFRHAHNKIAALEENEAAYLRQFFEAPSPVVMPFEAGRVYHRRQDIHGRFGGQEQGGISTPAQCPFVFLFTGDGGGQYGYRDQFRTDGSFEYTGEGQVGDMQFVRGNRAIRDHAADGKDLLLFEALRPKGQYRFLGTFACNGFDHRPGTDRDGNTRQNIVFSLVPLELLQHDAEAVPASHQSLSELRRAAYVAARLEAKAHEGAPRTAYERSREVRAYVLARANGACECCERPAPFVRTDGSPYLEPHHTRRVSDGGPDHPRWVGAICPTCHRQIHHGRDGQAVNARLEERLRKIEMVEP